MPQEPESRIAVRVLLVEDDELFATFVRSLFRDSPAFARFDIALAHVPTLRQAEEALRYEKFDLVLLDLGLSNGSGVEVMRRAAAATSSEPIIVLTGRSCPEAAAQAIEHGMDDFLSKTSIGPAGSTLAERMGRALSKAARDPARRGRLSSAVSRMASDTDRMRYPST
jgi:DNA-binding response OmpR family regulator